MQNNVQLRKTFNAYQNAIVNGGPYGGQQSPKGQVNGEINVNQSIGDTVIMQNGQRKSIQSIMNHVFDADSSLNGSQLSAKKLNNI